MKYLLTARTTAVIAFAIASLGLMNGQLCAQSAEKSQQGSAAKSSASTQQGSGAKSTMTAALGLDGYCPVCVVVGKGWVKGDPNIQTTYDGKTYYFPSAEVKQMYDTNPVKYTPALGVDCTVCLKMLGKRVPGSVQFSSMYKDRLYLFPDDEVRTKFSNAPEDFANFDLASNGDCTVCTVELQKQVAGSPDFVTMHKGMRYQFPAAEQMKMFVANPAKYEVADPPAAK